MDYTANIDYSSLDTFLTCPRKFMFRYMMHLSRSGPSSLDLIFGSCWHYGKEEAFKTLKESPDVPAADLTQVAINAFNELWQAEAAPFFDPDACFPKNPGRAHDMFYKFFSEHIITFRASEILAIESPFTVHLKEDMPIYTGRLDLVLLHPTDGLEIIDWKTAKFANDTTFSGFEVSLQTDGYLTAGNLYFDALPRITYWVALCQKTKMDFFPHTVRRGLKSIDRFLDDLVAHTADILRNRYLYLELLDKHKANHLPKDYNLPCFRRKPGYACTLYFRRCDYFDICTTRNNPIDWATNPPQGYTYDEWDPAKVDPKAKIAQTQAQ